MKKLLLSTLMLLFSALTVSVQAQTYCSPTYSATSNVGSISSIKVTGLGVNASWSDSNDHANRLAATVNDFFNVYAGTELTLNFSSKNATWGSVRVYVDLNGNNVFDADENIARVGEFSQTGTGEKTITDQKFTISKSVQKGTYLMRVFFVAQAQTDEWNSTDPCGTYTEGGYYDFYFNVGNLNQVTSSVVFSPVSGTNFVAGSDATITLTSEDGATIYYTTDSTEPQVGSGNSVQSGSSITLDTDQPWGTVVTVKAVAKAGEKDASFVSSAAYTISSPYCTPTANAQGLVSTNYVGQITTLTTTGAEVNADWTNPRTTENYNGYVGVIANTFTAKAGQTVTLNIASKNTLWGAIRVYADLNGNYQFDDNENIARVGDANDGASEKSVSQEFTIDASTQAGIYLMRVFYVARSNGTTEIDSTDPCGTYTEGGYYDFAFNVEADEPVPTEDKEVTVSESETGDAAYLTVTVKADDATAAAPVWSIGANTVTAQALNIEVAADGATPEISIDGNGSISAQTIKVVRKITSDQWTLMSMPFTFNLSEVQVNGVAANYNDNIRIKEYDAALRANNSVDGYTASGWVEKTSGTIAANEGFAIVVNPANGAEQTVTFTTTGFTMDANDKQITFTEQPSNANVINGKSMDSDWNLKGNPMLQSAEKGQGYTLYVHEAGTNTYRELSSTDRHTYSPFVTWFVQCDNDGGFMNLTFSHNGTSTYGSSMEDNITGRFDIVINGGEDEARVTVLEGSSEMYERNEDAMYFAPLNNKISQLYLIDKEGAQIASSVVPAPYDEVKLAYKAAVAGAQTLTVTSVIPGTAVYLVDNEEGTETLMNEGCEYSFTSEAGLNSERFAVKTIVDVTGIEESTAETSSVSAVVTGDAVKIYGATAGETIDVYTVNGVMVSSAVAVEGENEISVPAQGVLIVKVGDEVVKIVK